MLTRLSFPQASTAPCGEISPEPPIPLVGKENPGKTTCTTSTLWVALWVSPYSNRTPQGLQGNQWGSTLGNLIMIEKEGGAHNNQHTNLGRSNSYLQCPKTNPNKQFSSSAEPSKGSTLTRKQDGVQIRLFQILKGVLMALEPSLPMTRKGAKSQPYLLWRMSSDSTWPEGLMATPESSTAQQHSSWDMGG